MLQAPRAHVFRFVILYFVVGCLWIILSDRLLLALFPVQVEFASFQTLKGLFYVTITALLLWGFIRRSTRRLRHSERFLDSTFNALANHIAVVDEAGTILSVNKAWMRFAQKGGAQVEAVGPGANYLAVCDRAAEVGNQVAAEASQGIRSVLEGASEEFMQEYPCHAPQQSQWFVMRVSPFEEHGIMRAVISHEDITERKQAEQALREAREQAEETSSIKSALLNNMSHELRTPLTAVLGFSDLLEKQLEGEPQLFAREIRHGGQRLLQTIDAIFDLSMLEAGSFVLKPQVCDLVAEVQAGVEEFRAIAAEKGLAFHVEVPTSPVYARLDPEAFRRALSHLIQNAIKFTKRGEIWVRVSARPEEGLVSVQDTGVGIAKTFLAHLFTPFKQESAGLARSYEGVGLGLRIVKQLVALQDGHIEVESQKGVGTTFQLIFPRLAPLPGTESSQVDALPASTEAFARVLVVDDSPAMRLLLENMLHTIPEIKHVETAGCTEEALQLARQHRFHACLLDINLGEALTGTDVLNQLRQMPAYAHTPIVALTAYALAGDEARFLGEGFDMYLSKPVDPVFLQDRLTPLLYSVPAS